MNGMKGHCFFIFIIMVIKVEVMVAISAWWLEVIWNKSGLCSFDEFYISDTIKAASALRLWKIFSRDKMLRHFKLPRKYFTSRFEFNYLHKIVYALNSCLKIKNICIYRLGKKVHHQNIIKFISTKLVD